MTEVHADDSVVAAKGIFPEAYGHEHETGHMINHQFADTMSETAYFAEHYSKFLPEELLPDADYYGEVDFLLNGFKVYKGGEKIVEVVTPECSSPLDLVHRRRAAEMLWENMVSNLAAFASELRDGAEVHVRTQSRVIDGHVSRKASHMNVGLPDSVLEPEEVMYVLEHMAARGFATGAGYVGVRGPRYSQKVGGLHDVNGYGEHGSMFRQISVADSVRFEDRCGDLNISDWAVWQHAGSLALAVAVSKIPVLREQLPAMPLRNQPLEMAKQVNPMVIDEDRRIQPNRFGLAAVDFEQSLAELIMDKLIYYVDVLPDMYYDVAQALYSYCDDYRKVLKGDAELSILADRADWAAKFQLILRGIERDRGFGIRREFGDYQSQAVDLRYDLKRVTARDGEVVEVRKGLGYKLRDRGTLANMVRPLDVERAYRQPPTDTRASLRVDLLKRYRILSCDWTGVQIMDADGRTERIQLGGVTSTVFSADARAKFTTIKEKN